MHRCSRKCREPSFEAVVPECPQMSLIATKTTVKRHYASRTEENVALSASYCPSLSLIGLCCRNDRRCKVGFTAGKRLTGYRFTLRAGQTSA